MTTTIQICQRGRNSNQYKEFLVSTSLEDLLNHFLKYLDRINPNVYENPRKNGSIETAIILAEHYVCRFLNDSNPDFIFRRIGQTQLKEQLLDLGKVHPTSGRPIKGQLEVIEREINNLIYFWFFVAAAEGKLACKSPWPPVELQYSSDIVQTGILQTLNDIEILTIFCSTKEGLQRAKKLGLFTASFIPVVDQLCEVYSSFLSRVDGIYKPSATYVLREYVISEYWNRSTIDASQINEIKTNLILMSKNAQYSLSSVIEVLIHQNLITLNGNVIDLKDYAQFLDTVHGKNEALLKKYRAEKVRKKYKSLVNNHDARLMRLNYQLGNEYSTNEYGTLVYKDLIKENLFFTVRKEFKSSHQRMFGRFHSDSEADKKVETFKLLNEIQKDYLKEKLQSKQKVTVKSLKSSIGDLNEYLCDYLFNFAKENGYDFLDCSGENFLKTKLAIAFNNSSFVQNYFEKNYDVSIKPIIFKDWLAKKKLSHSVSGIKTRHAMAFFDYCEGVANQMNIKFINPMMNTDVTSNGVESKETTKEVFGFVEWIIWSELVTQCLNALGAHHKNRLISKKSNFSSSAEQALITGKEFEFIIDHYKLKISLTHEMVSNAIQNYEYQYDNIWSKCIKLDSISFTTCLAAIVVMVHTGIRGHSATNLQFEGLLLGKTDVYSRINVIADKVNLNGFPSHLPNEVLDNLFKLREVLQSLSPISFRNKREIEQGGSDSLYIDGLFGTVANCDEIGVSIVSDFFFYLFNELVRAVNVKLGIKKVSEIPILFMPRSEKRGSGFNFKNKVFSADIYTLPLEYAIENPKELLGKNVSPALSIIQRPNRTVHSFRASLVTNLSLAGMNPAAIKLLTGQEAPTVNHYTKATNENLKILALEGILGLSKNMLKEAANSGKAKSIEEIQDFVKQGIATSGGMTCSFGDVVNGSELDIIYKTESKHISIHATHICPYNDTCPRYIKDMFEGNKDCALCPVSVSFISDLPAIAMKIKYHIDEAKHYQELSNSGVPEYQKHEFEQIWVKHSREISMWLARYDLLSRNGKTIAGAKVLTDSKDTLLEFRCEDNDVLSRVLEIIETRDHYQYQSDELKANARMMQLRMGNAFGEIDTRLFNLNPVESVCRTIEKMMDIHQIDVDDVLKFFNSEVEITQLMNSNHQVIAGLL